MRIFLKNGSFCFINTMKCNSTSFTSPILKNILVKSFIFGAPTFKIKRPEIGKLLLGLDSINQFDIIIKRLSEDYTYLTMSEPKHNISYSLPFEDQSTYKILLIKSGLNLFYNGVPSPFGKIEKDSIVTYNTTYKVYKDESSVNNIIFKSNRPLNLIILSSLCYSDEREVKSKILINPNIDGFIFKNCDSKLEIWLKSAEYITKNNEVSNNELKDIMIIHNAILSIWLVDSDLNKILE
jgi:uncharacterized protein YlaI